MRFLKCLVLPVFLLSLVTSFTVAQDKKVEIVPFFGYTASGGIPVSRTEIEPGVSWTG
jgi:hypothetical protein